MDAQEEAIEAMARAGFKRGRELCLTEPFENLQLQAEFDVEWDDLATDVRAHLIESERASLDALTSPRTVECETCGVKGWTIRGEEDARPNGYKTTCTACSGSGRIKKGPIAYLAGELEQVGWWFPNLTNRRLYPMGHSDALYTEYDGQPVYVFRLPIPSHQSPNGTDPFTVEELRELTAEVIPTTEVIPPRRGRIRPDESPKGGA